MSTNISLAARRIVAGALTAAALTTGVGLLGSGIAEAAPEPQACVTNVSGTTTVNDHGKISTLPVSFSRPLCIFQHNVHINGPFYDEGTVGVASVQDPLHPGFNTEALPKVSLYNYSEYDGSVDVQLTNEVHNGKGAASQNPVTKKLTVYANGLKTGNGYTMHNVTIDAAGRTADTTVHFSVKAPVQR